MPSFEELPVPPFIDMGWRLSRQAWGCGYATEAARAVLHDGFTRLDLPEIDAITAAVNLRSRAVMERLGMAYRAGLDFDHPKLAEGDPLRRHVTYSIARTKAAA